MPMDAHRGNDRIGLALGGGGARGFAHIPVLEALDELGLKPSAIAGTSMGALIGAGYASGMSGADIRAYCVDLFSRRTEVFAKLWQLRPKRVRDFLAQGITQLNAERVIETFVPPWLPDDFAGLAIPLKTVATDFYGWGEVVLDRGSTRRAVAASAAIPVLFRPVVVDDRILIDGGITNPLPFDHVREGNDIVIAVDVIGGPVGSHTRSPRPTEAIFGAAQLLMQAVTREKLRSSPPPEILIRAPANAFRVLDFMKAGEILKAAEPVKDELKRKLDRVLAGQGHRLAAPRSSLVQSGERP
jgi:NTE family protein